MAQAQVNIEIDGKAIAVPANTTVIEAANRLGIYIPHFCYHKKLSIAANCRMCLVQIEKAPKPLPACATPVVEGMKVQTHSAAAIQAQKGVMEFLLINHPLDCPICDQGGECQLQDLAVGYGASNSRYEEAKRVVTNKDLGPLIATDMTRCIHCTRCVRFGQEIAGVMELGMVGRGEHAEIIQFVGQTVDSELSGNMIDLCPVGALTSKPFRYSARTWELARRRSVSPHCGLGANLVVHVKLDRVMRTLPMEQETLNECWLSDKDRFSYEGLNSPQRLTRPMIRREGKWEETDWPIALEYAARGLKSALEKRGPKAIGALASPHSTFEELYLMQRLLRGVGCGNVDFRLRQSDFALDGKLEGAPWLGMRVEEIGALDRVLVIGSQLRKDHPLLAHRLRQAAKKGTQVNLLHVLDDDQLIGIHAKAIVPPAALVESLGRILKAVATAKGMPVAADVLGLVDGVSVSDEAQAIANSLVAGQRSAVLLGNLAQHHPQASQLHQLGLALAELLGAPFGVLGEAANSVGGYIARAVPFGEVAGLNARQMLAQPLAAYLLLHAEPELDCHDPRQALATLRVAEFVVAMSPFRTRAIEYADVLLPIAPFTETAGAFINTEGRLQSFHGVVRPLGETRPGWKVLRVLGNLLGVSGFNYDSAEQARNEALDGREVRDLLSNAIAARSPLARIDATTGGLQRIADVPIYFADPLARRSEPLQLTRDAAPPVVSMCSATMLRLGVAAGDRVRVSQGGGEAILLAWLDEGVPPECVRIPAAHASTAELGAMFGPASVARMSANEKVSA
jgi:NADH-quinone oxidoreductase subunit G